MQIPPSLPLSAVIKHHLIIESDLTAGNLLRMFSDGNTGIVINYKDPIIHCATIDKKEQQLPQSFIYGQQDKYQTIFTRRQIGMIVVVLHPFGASALLKVPAIELRNQILDLSLFYPSSTENLLDRIQSCESISAKIEILEAFFMSNLRSQHDAGKLARAAVKLIDNRNGVVRVGQITNFFGVGERRLQRTFEQNVGISPKQYSGLVRIQHFLKLLRTDRSSTSLISLAYDAGFYDQAHLIREVKNLSGLTPGQYLSQSALLAANFIQINI